MYATKRRQRNFKRVREPPKPGAASNPSKRHRERLNGELETVAALLPYDQSVISRLDKLSVLRLAVSYLQVKSHFQVWLQKQYVQYPYHYPYHPSASFGSLVQQHSPYVVDKRNVFDESALKALGGFIMILNENGEIYYASENIETFLGFHQSDILHQPLYDMIHSEDRDEIRQQLLWNYLLPPHATVQDLFTPEGQPYLERNANARFRCLLDNTCGFLRIDIRGKLVALHGLPHSYLVGRADPAIGTVLGLVAVCSPFVPPPNLDGPDSEPFLKTKHALDFTLFSLDPKARSVLELDDKAIPISFYAIVHCEDAPCLAEAHKEVSKNGASGLLVYRMISAKTQRTYWVQSSCRQFYKNGKPESIGCTHRLLTEAEGLVLLEKRASLSAKLLSFDDSLLQSPKLLQSTAALTASSGTSTQASPSCATTPKPKKKTAASSRPPTATLPPSSRDSRASLHGLLALPQELSTLSGLSYLPQAAPSADPAVWSKQAAYCNYIPTAQDFYYQPAYHPPAQPYYPAGFQVLTQPTNDWVGYPPPVTSSTTDYVHKTALNGGIAEVPGSTAGFNLISEVTNTLLGQ